MSGHASHAQSMFDVQKAIAAIAYLVKQTGASMYPVMKMMYLADKLHLGKYGRFISGDTYCAMAKGPVPSCTYRMIQHVRGDCDDQVGLGTAREFFSYGADHQIVINKLPDFDELSASDVECLDEIVRVYKNVGRYAVRDMSHDDAWRKAWGDSISSRAKPMPIEVIAAELDNAGILLKHLADSQPGAA